MFRELHEDQRGAIMLMGLCMSCFLIGALWFIIGVGDAIVFRDMMQEAADHAAFTSAVVHAKGMNFISACNLILLGAILVHILLGIANDIALAACILWWPSCPAYIEVHDLYTGYAKILKSAIAPTIHKIELVAAYSYPYLGFVDAANIGSDYGKFGNPKRDVLTAAISPSMAPTGVLNLFSGKSSSKTKVGLPVEPKPYDSVCDRIAKGGVDFLMETIGKNPNSKTAKFAKGIIGGILKFRYCNSCGADSNKDGTPVDNSKIDTSSKHAAGDLANTMKDANKKIGEGNAEIAANNQKNGTSDSPVDGVANSVINSAFSAACSGSFDPGFDTWWGEDGPLVPWSQTANGSAWQQVWAINWAPSYQDTSTHRVAIAKRMSERLVGQEDAPQSSYYAQAEFYFDCANQWSDTNCDGDDNAGYQMRWRARMRRLQLPEYGQMLAGFGLGFLENMKGFKDLQSLVTNKLGSLIGIDQISGVLSKIVGTGGYKGAVGASTDMLQDWINGQLTGSSLGPNKSGSYH
ncbi:MAG: hypothetical protein FWD69_09595 [Polyangiaceae bacterium]|nr:hypothetical protein [Polyangiaceae bacterium]